MYKEKWQSEKNKTSQSEVNIPNTMKASKKEEKIKTL